MTDRGRNRLRVLVLTTWFPSSERPAEAPFNLNHVTAISVHHEVTVAHVALRSTRRRRGDVHEGVTVFRMALDFHRPWRAVGVVRELRRLAKGCDVVHTMAFSSILVAIPVLLFVRKPWVHTEHWNGVVDPSSVSRRWASLSWVRMLLRRPDWLTGVTTQLAEVLAQFGREQTTSVVPCVVDNPLPVTESRAGGPLRMVAVGAVIARKRPMLALRTLEWLTENGYDSTMTWVGDGPLRAEIEAMVARMRLSARFTITGSKHPRDVFDYYDEAEIFFLPTEQENFFTAAAEALSAGRPVVAARVGGFSDYADDRNSVLVDEPSPENFGRAVLAARERFESTSAATIADPIRDRFSMVRIGDQFDEIYARVVRAGARG